MTKTGINMTEGNIRKHIIKFSVPLFLGNLLQISYTMVNRMWAGKFLGKEALSAASISSLIGFIMMAFAIGMTMSTNILISQYYGAKNYKNIKSTVANSFIVIGIIALITNLGLIFFAEKILLIMNTPYEILEMSKSYLIIISYSSVFVFGFNLISFIFRAIGDSVSPLKFLAVSVVINVILDPFLMLGIGPFPKMGLNGAAVALLFSQGIAFIWSFIYLQKKGGFASLTLKEFKFNKVIALKIIKIGVPSSVQQTIIALGIAVIQAYINGFGSDAIAAYAAAGNIDNIVFQPASSINAAVCAIVGQNIGANKMDRVNKTIKYGLIINTLVIVGVSILCLVIPNILLSAFINKSDVNAMKIGVDYLRIMAIPYIFICNMIVFNGLFNGAGDTVAAMMIAFANLWAFRVPFAKLFSRYFGINGVGMGIALSFVVSFFLAFIYYKTGRWKRKAIIKQNSSIIIEVGK